MSEEATPAETTTEDNAVEENPIDRKKEREMEGRSVWDGCVEYNGAG